MTNQKHYPGLGSDASSVWNFCTCFSDIIISHGSSGGAMECCLLSQAMLIEESFNTSIDQIEKLPCLHNYINIAFCKIVRHNIVSQH